MKRKLRSVCATAGCLLFLHGCARDEGPTAELCAETDAAVVDPVLLSFLSRARAAHHAADLHERAGRSEAALKTLIALTEGPLPEGRPVMPEVREVLADTHGRIAELHNQLGNREKALQSVEAGLRLVPERTYFRGRLLEVQGLVHEQRALELGDAGQPEAAEQARKSALESLEDAMKIQADVIERSLNKADGGS